MPNIIDDLSTTHVTQGTSIIIDERAQPSVKLKPAAHAWRRRDVDAPLIVNILTPWQIERHHPIDWSIDIFILPGRCFAQ